MDAQQINVLVLGDGAGGLAAMAPAGLARRACRRRVQHVLAAVLAAILAAGGSGCAGEPLPHAKPLGNVDPNSGLVVALWKVDRNGVHTPVVVSQPYGMFILYQGPERRFFIYDNARKRTFKTTDVDLFIRELGTLPPEVDIERIDTCSAPSDYDMPMEQYWRIQQVMTAGRRGWAINPINGLQKTIFCRCEVLEMLYP